MNGRLQRVRVAIPTSSLASQALAPPPSHQEMSCNGRVFADIGEKLFALRPLGRQEVHPNDSVLGPLANPRGNGLRISYPALIKKAFQPAWWGSKTPVFFRQRDYVAHSNEDPTEQIFEINRNPGALEFELDRNSGGLNTDTDEEPLVEAFSDETLPFQPLFEALEEDVLEEEDRRPHRFSQMEANFSLFFGLAVQLYESTLISDRTPVDRFLAGQDTLNAAELRGLDIFQNQGRCINCHGGAETTNASVSNVLGERLERMIMGNGEVAVYDNGFYNISVRPTQEDIALGGIDPFGFPLSETAMVQIGREELLGNNFDPDEEPNVGPNDRIAVDGAFKTPTLRNVELTAPYFHNGGKLTLMEVVEFYNRGGDFADRNIADLDADIVPLGLTQRQQKDLVAFLLALTDERVRFQRAPFDHPQLCFPVGHPGNSMRTISEPGSINAITLIGCIPAVGARGGEPLALFQEQLNNADGESRDQDGLE